MSDSSTCRTGAAIIPGGPFWMGSERDSSTAKGGPREEVTANESPRHEVEVSTYCIDESEVTNRQWQEVTGKRPPSPKGFDGPNQPVVNVNWREADAYCKLIGGRLPREAEWEKASGGSFNPVEAVYNTDRTADVRSRAPNGYGIFDMIGNVSEWVSDWYDENYYKDSPKKDPQGPPPGKLKLKVMRGGSYGNGEPGLKVTLRSFLPPRFRYKFVGFRCVEPQALGTLKIEGSKK